MSWDSIALDWLARAAAGGFAILAAAAVAARLCREPADRVRIAAIGLLGAPWFPVWHSSRNSRAGRSGCCPAEPAKVSSLPIQQPEIPSGLALENRVVLEPFATQTESVANESQSAPATKIAPTANVTTQESSTSSTWPATSILPDAMSATAPSYSAWRISLAVLVTYGAATSGFIIWSILGLWRLMLLWRRARVAPPEIRAVLRDIAGPSCERVQLLISDEIDAPVAFATWRPIILLPAGICADAVNETLRYGLAHEWSHIERGDVRRWYLVALAQVVLFYQPLFWWLRRQIRLSQDFLADARSADQAIDPIDYAQYLVSLARRSHPQLCTRDHGPAVQPHPESSHVAPER